MRTTVTLDDDVAILLKGKMVREKMTFKEALNQALRQALAHGRLRRPTAEPYQTPEVELGRCFLGNVDDVADVLAVAEGEEYR